MPEEEKSLAPTVGGKLVAASGAEELLLKVRETWQAKGWIERVKKLLSIDPSSACQRILNPAIHDFREKILVAGLDLAKEAAVGSSFPPYNNLSK